LREGLDRANHIDLAQEINFCAQRFFGGGEDKRQSFTLFWTLEGTRRANQSRS